MKSVTRFSICGAAAGLLNGFFGAGGGILLVPLLMHLGRLESREAFSTSLSIMLPLTFVSLLVHRLSGELPLAASLPYGLGGLLGGLIGGLLFKRVPVKVLHLIFGLFIIGGGIRLLWN